MSVPIGGRDESGDITLITLGEAFDMYRSEVIVLKGQSPRTEEGLLVTKKVAVGYFGDVSVKNLTIDQVRKFHQHFRGKRLKTNTIRGYLLNFRSVIRYAKQKGLDIFDPELIIVPKREENIPFVLNAKEVQHAINSIQPQRGRKREYVPRNKAIVSLLYASGLRVSEMCSLDRRVAQEGSATVIGKGNKPRLVFWDDRTKHLLSEYLSTRLDSNPALFTSPISGKRMNRYDVLEVFTKLKKQSGLENIHAHSLRHSFATNLMANGMHIYTLSRLMGHSSIQTTQKYLHISDPQLGDEYKKHHTI